MSVHNRGAHWDPTLVPAFHDLKQAYDEGNLIAFVGAGVSAAAGLPTWPQLAQELLKYGHAQQLNEAATSEIGSLINHYELIEAFTELKSALGATSFCHAIEKHLNDRNSQVPEVANSIARLAPKLRAIITTNLDHILERAFAGSWQATANPPADIAQRRDFILKAHGTLLDRSTWVFTRDEYDRAIHNNHNLKNAIRSILHAFPVLFIGYGLSDGDLDAALSETRAFSGNQPPRHFAILPESNLPTSKARRLEQSGISLLRYPNLGHDHREVIDTLNALTTSKAEARHISEAPPRAAPIQAHLVTNPQQISTTKTPQTHNPKDTTGTHITEQATPKPKRLRWLATATASVFSLGIFYRQAKQVPPPSTDAQLPQASPAKPQHTSFSASPVPKAQIPSPPANPLTLRQIEDYIGDVSKTDMQRQHFRNKHRGTRVQWRAIVDNIHERSAYPNIISFIMVFHSPEETDKPFPAYYAATFPSSEQAKLAGLEKGSQVLIEGRLEFMSNLNNDANLEDAMIIAAPAINKADAQSTD